MSRARRKLTDLLPEAENDAPHSGSSSTGIDKEENDMPTILIDLIRSFAYSCAQKKRWKEMDKASKQKEEK